MFSQAKKKSSTQSQKSTNIQIIPSSIEPTQNGEDPLFTDDDDDLFENEEIFKQLDEVESSNNLKLRKSPQNIVSIPKPKRNPIKLASIGPATQTSECSATINAKSNENPDKRQRSFLDCLDDAYYKETPLKMKRESQSSTNRFPCSKSNTIVSLLDKSMQVSKNNVTGDGNSSRESNDPESLDINTENDHLSNENDVNSESIKEMDDGLESLHVVSRTSKENSVNSDNCIPATPPSTMTHQSNDNGQKSMFDYFKKS